jgi:L-arabinose isomerase
VVLERITTPQVKIGVFGIGLHAYWDQFPGLKERLEGYQRRVEERLRETIGASMRVSLLAPGFGPRSEGGKLARVDDRRQLA